jgi:hypothetical protein
MRLVVETESFCAGKYRKPIVRQPIAIADDVVAHWAKATVRRSPSVRGPRRSRRLASPCHESTPARRPIHCILIRPRDHPAWSSCDRNDTPQVVPVNGRAAYAQAKVMLFQGFVSGTSPRSRQPRPCTRYRC